MRCVLVTAPKLAQTGVNRLNEAGCRTIFLTRTQDAGEIEEIMAREPVEAVISRTLDLTACAIDACPTLKVVSKHGVGVSNIDVAACTRRGIPVFVTPGANAQSVAELAIGLMFGVARKIAWLDREIRDGRWSRAQDGVELFGKTIGLVGFGQVGQRVARICLATGMKVKAFDPILKGASPVGGVDLVSSFEELLPASDVLSLHVPLTPKTRSMIGAGQIARLPKGAILINTARGEVVDEPALIDALRSGHLHGAGLDTMATEPLPAASPLATMANVILTPHVGGSTPGALSAMASGAADNILRFLDGRPVDPAACVNPETLSASSSSTSMTGHS